MTFDQKIQIANTIGTWLAGLATLGAVIVSLYLARRTDKIKLRAFVNISLKIVRGNSNRSRYITIMITNEGSRIITINSIAWVVGKKKKSYCMQLFDDPDSANYPVTLTDGQKAIFLIPLETEPLFLPKFCGDFIKDCSLKNSKTLRLIVSPSVGKDLYFKPGKDLIEQITKS